MRLQDRFRRTCAIIVLSSAYKDKQDALASALRAELQLDEKADLRPLVTRYLHGEVVSSGFFEVIHVIFMRSVVAGDYPPHFLSWLDRAYGSYDLCASGDSLGKRDGLFVRALLAEARLLFAKPSPAGEVAYPRYEAARQLMLGMAAAVEQRTLKAGPEHVNGGIKHLQQAIRLFGKLKPGARALSDSDEFHIAHAQHMIDWLLSELPESESLRKQTLESMRELGALRAYEWLASKINDWQHQYNVTEIHGELSAPALGDTAPFVPPRAGIDSLVRAIELNPRLADFDADTKFDGVDEPLSKAPALQHILPAIRRERGEWLNERVKVYRRHADLYKKDVAKGIKAMLKDLKSVEKKSMAIKRGLAVIVGAVFALATSSFLVDCLAAAKPIF